MAICWDNCSTYTEGSTGDTPGAAFAPEDDGVVEGGHVPIPESTCDRGRAIAAVGGGKLGALDVLRDGGRGRGNLRKAHRRGAAHMERPRARRWRSRKHATACGWERNGEAPRRRPGAHKTVDAVALAVAGDMR